MLVFSLLLNFYTAMLPRSAPNCIDINQLSTKEKSSLLTSFGIPSYLFEDDVYEDIYIGRSVLEQDEEPPGFYALRYNTTLPIIAKQFKFFRNLLRQLQWKIFLRSEKVFCFIDTEFSYLIVRHISSKSYSKVLGGINIEKVKINFLEKIEVYRILNNYGGVFFGEVLHRFVSLRNNVEFNILNLDKVYALGDKYYERIDICLDKNNSSEAQNPLIVEIHGRYSLRGHQYQVHSLLRTVENSMNTHWISTFEEESYIIFRKKNLLRKDKHMLNRFFEKLDELEAKLKTEKNYTHTWKKVVEFISSWGKKGELAALLKFGPSPPTSDDSSDSSSS